MHGHLHGSRPTCLVPLASPAASAGEHSRLWCCWGLEGNDVVMVEYVEEDEEHTEQSEAEANEQDGIGRVGVLWWRHTRALACVTVAFRALLT